MSQQDLAKLLEAIGRSLLVPGQVLEWDQAVPLDDARLEDALLRLDKIPREQLETIYAGLFLHGFRHPTIHLEESVMRCGTLRSREVIGDLERHYAVAGLEMNAPCEMDHLGVMATLLGYLLNQINALGNEGPADLHQAASDLVRDHIRPLQRHVAERLEQVDAHPYYRSLLELLGLAAEAGSGLLIHQALV